MALSGPFFGHERAAATDGWVMNRVIQALAAFSLSACVTASAPDPVADRRPDPELRGEIGATSQPPNPDPHPVSSVAGIGGLALAPNDGAAMHVATADELARYAWLTEGTKVRSLDAAIAPPPGFHRAEEAEGTFGAWLRHLPLRAPRAPVLSFAGAVLRDANDPRIAAVAELDVGAADLQQCADSVIRLHAEWQWSKGAHDDIGYHFLSGDLATYRMYSAGQRPVVDGRKVVWRATAKASDGHASFRSYLDVVFNYASTISLAQHTDAVEKRAIAAGDFFILPGGPGHAVLVLDIATSAEGKRVALLGQGYMPAQDFQVLGAQSDATGPWFSLDDSSVDTPFWVPFPWTALHRFGTGESAHPPSGR